MRNKIYLKCVILFVLIYFPQNIIQENTHKPSICIKETVEEIFFFFENGIFTNSVTDYFSVFITSDFVKIDSPGLSEILIYDDKNGTISYLFMDKKVYMLANPEKEPEKKKTRELTENPRLWNTGKKGKHFIWDIEVWLELRYGTKESKIGWIETLSYITRELSYPQAFYNYCTADEKLYTINSESIVGRASLPGPSVWSITKFYNKSLQTEYGSIERVIDIQYIKLDDSIFKIPDDYKKVEWNPDLFKHRD